MRACLLLSLSAIFLATAASAQTLGFGKPSPPTSIFAGQQPARIKPYQPYDPYAGYKAPRAQAPMPEAKPFRPYGDRSPMKRGGPGGYPSAPKPKGYVDYYGTKPSEHPFLY